jgi:hypothetical protein
MTVAAHLQELIKQKKALANNLVEKGVQASEDEKFNTLVPKVLDISGGSSGEDISEEVTKYSSLNDELEAVINSLPDISEGGNSDKKPQNKSVEYVKNGEYLVQPADGYVLENVNVKVNVPIPEGYLKPTGSVEIYKNGIFNIAEYKTVYVNVDGAKPEQSKSVVPTKTTQTILPDTGYVLNKVIIEPIPEEYIVPNGTINITENGTYNITEKASAVVAIPEKQILLQDKTIEANGTYSADEGYDGLGQVTVEVAGWTNTESEEVAGLLGNTMTILDNSLVTSLRTRACQGATKLVTVNLPNVTSLGSYAFYQCSGLETITLPKLTTISTQTFYTCTKLKHADCGQLGNLPAQTFATCNSLTELILRNTTSICTLSNVNAINSTPIAKGTGYVYVPKALLSDEDETKDYRRATNWSTYPEQFRAIEDYPEICEV